jgi:RNA polymerase sigma factor (sigma-70 family)
VSATRDGPEGDERLRFRHIYVANYERILGYAIRRGASTEDSADVVAETFLIAWRRLDDVPTGKEASAWLYGVARRVLGNQRRGALRRARLTARLAQEIASLDRTTSPANDAGVALAGFQALRPADREILGLASWEGLSIAELTAALGCSPNAAKIRLHRARRRLVRELAKRGVDLKPDGSPGHVDHGWARVTQEERDAR